MMVEAVEPVNLPKVMKKKEFIGWKVKALTDQQLRNIVINYDIVVQFLKAAQSHAAARYFTTNPIPDLKMVAGRRGKRRWKNETAAAEWARKQKIKGAFQPAKLLSVAQLEKLYAEIPKKLIEQSPAGAKLVLADDPRPALDNTSDALKLLEAFDGDSAAE